ncbi:MAG: porin [Pseudomonadota bacterium]
MTLIFKHQLNFRSIVALVGIFPVFATAGSQAEENQRFSIRGFGTVGAAHSNNELAEYATNLNQPSGPGRGRSWDFTADTKAGIQLDGKLTNQLAAVVQLTSRKLASNGFQPEVEWANIKYQATPDFSVRLGRVALSTLMQSDARLVSYSLVPVRVPVEIYNITPPTNSDGIDATYVAHFGMATNTLQASFGRTKTKLAVGIPDGVVISEVQARKIINIANTLESGRLSLRASYFKANLSIPGFTYRYDMKAIGALYDLGVWFVQGEVAKSNGGGLTKNQEALYALGGVRLSAVTPYASYAKANPQDPQLPSGAGFKQTTATFGVRWDYSANTALKLQYDRIDAPGLRATQGSGSYFIKQTTSFLLNGGKINLVSAAVDFVF